jgi:hypothetical protein
MTRSAEGILPGRARCDDDLAYAHALDPALEVSAVDGIAIAEQVSGAGLVRERVDDLLGRPRGGGLVSDADVDKLSAVVADVVAFRPLDLDHVGAHVTEEHRAVGAGEVRGEVDDAEPLERHGHRTLNPVVTTVGGASLAASISANAGGRKCCGQTRA